MLRSSAWTKQGAHNACVHSTRTLGPALHHSWHDLQTCFSTASLFMMVTHFAKPCVGQVASVLVADRQRTTFFAAIQLCESVEGICLLSSSFLQHLGALEGDIFHSILPGFLKCFPAYRSLLPPHPVRPCCWLTHKISASK